MARLGVGRDTRVVLYDCRFSMGLPGVAYAALDRI